MRHPIFSTAGAALPLVPPDLRRLSFRQFAVDGRVGEGSDARFYRTQGEVVALTTTPEPTTASLLGIGLAGVLVAVKRRRLGPTR
jgi:hypothetical protein